MMTMQTVPLADVQAHLSRYVDDVATHDRVVITRNGRPAAVLISPDDLESLEETLAVLRDPDTLRAMAVANSELDAGEGIGPEDLLADLAHRTRTERAAG
jgi:antitoxin YefM